MIRPPPRPNLPPTPFPYTTLCRSHLHGDVAAERPLPAPVHDAGAAAADDLDEIDAGDLRCRRVRSRAHDGALPTSVSASTADRLFGPDRKSTRLNSSH